MDRQAKFWDRIAERYSRKPVADEESYRHKLAITRKYFNPAMRVLEIGCGTGSTAIAHAPYVKHIEAVDFSAKMIEIAERRAAAAGIENITFTQSSIGELEAEGRSFDAVLALSVLHLLDDKDAAILEVHRLLKPGGVFVSSTVCLGDSMSYMKPVLALGRVLGLIPFVAFFTTAQLVDSLTNAGFSIAHRWQPGKNTGVFIVATKAA